MASSQSGFDRIKSIEVVPSKAGEPTKKDSPEFVKLREFVSNIKKAMKEPNSGSEGSSITKQPNYKRAVDMLVTDIDYIKDNIESLQKDQNSNNVKRADTLLQFLMDAQKKRSTADFNDNSVNLRKLLQIIAKLKLWVPPQKKEDESDKSKAAAKKKEESPFETSKEKDNAATEILTELFGLRCKQWGLDGLLKSYGELTDTQKLCLLCFSAFHCQSEKLNKVKDAGSSNTSKTDENEDDEISKSLKIRKKILIHWWVAEGLIDLHSKPNPNPNPNPPPILNSNSIPTPVCNPDQEEKKTVEEIGEEILEVLKEKGFIDPVMKASQESSRVLMHPFVHSFVTALAKRAGFFDFSDKDGKLTPSFGLSQRACLVNFPDKQSSCKLWETYTDDRNKLKRFGTVQTLFNVNEPIIDIKPEWFSKMTELSILHLGSWRSDPVEHIEVEDTKFMEDFKTMVKMRLFSLQGVSTIMKLPDSVCRLKNLVILDLRECHNLEELPVDIGCLKSLTHLDITNCHLLTKLPKGISLLSKLEVLKGFVIYDQAGDKEVRKRCFLRRWCRKARGCVVHDVLRFKNKVECTLKDLEKLQELRELSIVVNIDEFPKEDEVEVFKNMRNLSKLKISWEKNFKNVKKSDAAAKQESENLPARGAGTAEQSDAGAKQESENPPARGAGTAEKSDAGAKQDSENPPATGAGTAEKSNADAKQESKNPSATGAGTAEQSDAGAKQESENPLATGAGTAEKSNADAKQESKNPSATGAGTAEQSDAGAKQESENPPAMGAGTAEKSNAGAKQESENPPATEAGTAEQSDAGAKQESENPPATEAGTAEQSDAGAKQESENPPATGAGTAEQSDAGAKQESENPPATGAGTAEKANAGAKQDSENPSAVPEATNDSCCLNRKCRKSSEKVNAESKVKSLDQIKKLELWCFPKKTAPEWLHRDQLTDLKKLYIKGGELAEVPGYYGSDKDMKEWQEITTLRLKYLPNLEITWLEFKAMFPNLTYLEKLDCDKLAYFPCDQEGVWQK